MKYAEVYVVPISFRIEQVRADSERLCCRQSILECFFLGQYGHEIRSRLLQFIAERSASKSVGDIFCCLKILNRTRYL